MKKFFLFLEGLKGQLEVDDPPQLGQGSGQHHRRGFNTVLRAFIKLLQGHQTVRGNEAVDGVAYARRFTPAVQLKQWKTAIALHRD